MSRMLHFFFVLHPDWGIATLLITTALWLKFILPIPDEKFTPPRVILLLGALVGVLYWIGV